MEPAFAVPTIDISRWVDGDDDAQKLAGSRGLELNPHAEREAARIGEHDS